MSPREFGADQRTKVLKKGTGYWKKPIMPLGLLKKRLRELPFQSGQVLSESFVSLIQLFVTTLAANCDRHLQTEARISNSNIKQPQLQERYWYQCFSNRISINFSAGTNHCI